MHSIFKFVLIGPPLILSVLIAVASVLSGYRPFAALLSDHLVTAVIARENYTTDRDFAELERAVELSPDNCTGWWSLVRSYATIVSESDTQYTVEDPAIKKALIAHEALFTHCADSTEANRGHLTHAEILQRSQQYQAALQAIDLFIATKPGQSSYVYNLTQAYAMKGEIYEKMGKPVEAFKAIEQSALYGDDSLKDDLQHMDTLNKYILASHSLERAIQPGQPAGFGRYVSGMETPDGRSYLLATAVSNPSLLSLFEFHPNANWGVIRLLMADPTPLGTIAADSAGYLHVAYAANDTAILYANTRNGLDKPIVVVDRTPAPPPAPPPSVSNLPPLYRSVQISVDAQGGAHLVWADDRYHVVEYTKVLGDMVSPPTIIAQNAAAPDIKVGQDGRVYVTYNGAAPFPDASTRLWLIEGSNGQWSKPFPIGQAGMWSGGASLVVQSDGSLDLIYLAGTSADSVQLFHTSRSSNGLWSPPEAIGSGVTRPWIPIGPNTSYGGRTGPAVAALANNGLAVVWRGSATSTGTPVFGRIRQNGIWGNIETLGWISGENFRDSPTIVSETKPVYNSLTLLWSNSGELVMCVWNFADTTSCK